MPKAIAKELNETQQQLVTETLTTFIEAVATLYKAKLLSSGVEILTDMKHVAVLDEEQDKAQQRIKDAIWDFQYSSNTNLRKLSNWLGRILQLSFGRSGDLRLHTIGGWLTYSQKESLRLMVAELLQQGIESFEAQITSKKYKQTGTDEVDTTTLKGYRHYIRTSTQHEPIHVYHQVIIGRRSFSKSGTTAKATATGSKVAAGTRRSRSPDMVQDPGAGTGASEQEAPPARRPR